MGSMISPAGPVQGLKALGDPPRPLAPGNTCPRGGSGSSKSPTGFSVQLWGKTLAAVGDRPSWYSPPSGCVLDSPTPEPQHCAAPLQGVADLQRRPKQWRPGPRRPRPPPLGLRLLTSGREPAEGRARRSRVPAPRPPRARCRGCCPGFSGSRVPPGSAEARPNGASAEGTTQSSRGK